MSLPLDRTRDASYERDMKRPRLSRDKWIAAGLDAFARQGPTALAAEPLARALGTTKGSFYWHFKDVPEFQYAVLTAWQSSALQEVITLLEQSGDADQRLRAFGRTLLQGQLEPQLRIWAQTDARAADALQEVDAQRHAYLTRLLGQLGLGNPAFADALQATLTGLPLMPQITDAGPYDALVDTVLALR